jgi:hypothetical protein
MSAQCRRNSAVTGRGTTARSTSRMPGLRVGTLHGIAADTVCTTTASDVSNETRSDFSIEDAVLSDPHRHGSSGPLRRSSSCGCEPGFGRSPPWPPQHPPSAVPGSAQASSSPNGAAHPSPPASIRRLQQQSGSITATRRVTRSRNGSRLIRIPYGSIPTLCRSDKRFEAISGTVRPLRYIPPSMPGIHGHGTAYIAVALITTDLPSATATFPVTTNSDSSLMPKRPLMSVLRTCPLESTT